MLIVNRSQTDSVVTELIWQAEIPQSVPQAYQLAGSDVKAASTWDNPDLITAQPISTPKITAGQTTIQLPSLSYTVLTTQVN